MNNDQDKNEDSGQSQEIKLTKKGETQSKPTAGQAPQSGPNPFKNSNTRVIAIASGKGGVGKSSLTTNLAIALAAQGKKVGALDADVWGFSMPRMLGIDAPPEVVGEKIIPPIKHGVKLISMGYFAREDQPVMWRGPMLHKALEQFLSDVEWGELDFLIIDMPPGTGDVSLSMSQFLPKSEMIVITTPQLAAQSVAQRAAFMAKSVGIGLLGVVENMSYFTGDDNIKYHIFGEGGGKHLASKLGLPFLGEVPLESGLRIGGDEGTPIIVSDPNSDSAKAIELIALEIINSKVTIAEDQKDLNLVK